MAKMRVEGSFVALITPFNADGSVEAEDVTVHWLRPIPPAERARGRASFALDAITIDIAAAQQSGTGIVVREGSVRIAFDTDPETAEIALVAAGPLADVWALLRHPRLHLFERRPPPIATIGRTMPFTRTCGMRTSSPPNVPPLSSRSRRLLHAALRISGRSPQHAPSRSFIAAFLSMTFSQTTAFILSSGERAADRTSSSSGASTTGR